MKKVVKTGTTLLLALSVFVTTYQAQAISQGETRVGLLAGSFMPQGDLSDAGSGLGYGLRFSYLFDDDLVFNISYLGSEVGDDIKHSEVSVLVDWYYQSYKNIFFTTMGGLALVQNDLDIQTEVLKGDGLALVGGVGVDFDVNQYFLAGFQLKYNFALKIEDTPAGSTTKTTTSDSYVTILTHLEYVF